MASHGIPRGPAIVKSEEARQKELEEIKSYQSLVETVNNEVAAKNYTPQLLRQTADLLRKNPEYYTIWNHRRRIYVHEFLSLDAGVQDGSISQPDRDSQVLDIIKLDLQFLFPLLLKFPKCYWIWNHRLWLLKSATDLLPAAIARKLWVEELGLVAKMLDRDPRNFHGWGYRRTVIASLESPKLDSGEASEIEGTSMAKPELDYTTKMIGANLSNFSAWHNRTKLILRLLDEQSASDAERKNMLDEEIKLIHKALFDPYDASLWAYHQNLLCTFDPLTSSSSMAPNLSFSERLDYLDKEKEFVLEFLDDEDEENVSEGKEDKSKWPYQRLIEIALISSRVRASEAAHEMPGRKGADTPQVGSSLDLNLDGKQEMKRWLGILYKLDPLRKGRWQDLEKSIGLS